MTPSIPLAARARRHFPLSSRTRAAAVGATLLAVACGGDAPETGEEAAPPSAAILVENVGFDVPESVLHEPGSDVYLVSNIAGGPLEKDGNGFISRVSPDGQVIELRWIDGADEDVRLDAPKGMAILEGTLYVTDIDCVRRFDVATGAPEGEACVSGATFLNDIATDQANGTLFVTDSGLGEGLAPVGTDAIYRITGDGTVGRVASGEDLGSPNGITVGPRGVFVVSFGSGEVYMLEPDGRKRPVMPASDRQLDGIEFLRDGSFVFSSWGERAVLLVSAEGAVTRVLEDVESPADIGYDAGRHRLLVPLFNENRVIIHPLEEG